MKKGLISAIVLNWNGKEFVFSCIDSLLAQNYASKEIIIVDNGSADGSAELIQSKYGSAVRLILNGKNLGFAGGCNVGIRAAEGEFIALINSDAALRPDWMGKMSAVFQDSARIGMAACKIYFWQRDGEIENVGHVISRDGLVRAKGRLEDDVGQYDHRRAVLCPSGCAALYRRAMLEECHMFDEKFFAYADDVDIGIRGRLAGYICRFVPDAIAYHRLSVSFGMITSLRAFLLERNRLWVVLKCFPLRHLMSAPGHTFVRYFYHALGVLHNRGPAAQYVRKTSWLGTVTILLKVYGSTLLNLPHLIQERRRIQKLKKISSRRFEFLLKRYGISDKDAALNELA